MVCEFKNETATASNAVKACEHAPSRHAGDVVLYMRDAGAAKEMVHGSGLHTTHIGGCDGDK